MTDAAKRSRLVDAQLEHVLVCRAERAYRLDPQDNAPAELAAAEATALPVIAVDLDEGRYRQYAADDPKATLADGQLSIVNAGSYQSPVDFVGVDPQNGLLLRIDLHELGFPFFAVGTDGLALTGRSEWERHLSR